MNRDLLPEAATVSDPAGEADLNEEEKEGSDREVFPQFLSELVAVQESD